MNGPNIMRRGAVVITGALLMLGAVWPISAAAGAQEFDPEARLRELGVQLHEPSPPIANYVRAVRAGNLVFLAGHGPCAPGRDCVTGKVPTERSVEEAYEAARLTAIELLSSLKGEIGDLRRVKRVVRVFGMVNSAPDFGQQPAVINGCSDLLVAVFGEARGKHVRAAVGMAALPRTMSVEIEMLVELEPE